MLNTTTKTTTETTITTGANRKNEERRARYQKALDESANRLAAMCGELSDIAEAAGELGECPFMDAVTEARAAIVRALRAAGGASAREVDREIETEASAAWAALGDDADGRRIRRHLAVALANIAADLRETTHGAFLAGGDHRHIEAIGRKAPKTAKRAGKAVAK